MINKVFLEGRATRDPKISFTRTENKKVANLRIAVRMSKNYTDFIDVSAWEDVADTIQNYVKKGDLISVEGRLKTEKRQKDDVTYYQQSVVVQQVHFLTKKQETGSSQKDLVPQSDDYGAEYSDSDYPDYM